MITAGFIIWANCVERKNEQHLGWGTTPLSLDAEIYGWPSPFIRFKYVFVTWPVIQVIRSNEPDILVVNLLLNVFAILAILFYVWRACEGWIRYREERRT